MPQMSQVLRERAIGMLTAGMSTRAAAHEFNVNFSTISRLQRHFREFGSPSKRNINYIFILICYAVTLKLLQKHVFKYLQLLRILLSSQPTTCPLDPIPSHLLQAISSTLLPALTHIINTSLLTGIFPTAFKQAQVTPLLKKPTFNTSLIENYRPVSLLQFIAKTLERVVFNQVSSVLSQNNKLDTKQSGFRSGHSTETALLSVTVGLERAPGFYGKFGSFI